MVEDVGCTLGSLLASQLPIYTVLLTSSSEQNSGDSKVSALADHYLTLYHHHKLMDLYNNHSYHHDLLPHHLYPHLHLTQALTVL